MVQKGDRAVGTVNQLNVTVLPIVTSCDADYEAQRLRRRRSAQAKFWVLPRELPGEGQQVAPNHLQVFLHCHWIDAATVNPCKFHRCANPSLRTSKSFVVKMTNGIWEQWAAIVVLFAKRPDPRSDNLNRKACNFSQ